MSKEIKKEIEKPADCRFKRDGDFLYAMIQNGHCEYDLDVLSVDDSFEKVWSVEVIDCNSAEDVMNLLIQKYNNNETFGLFYESYAQNWGSEIQIFRINVKNLSMKFIESLIELARVEGVADSGADDWYFDYYPGLVEMVEDMLEAILSCYTDKALKLNVIEMYKRAMEEVTNVLDTHNPQLNFIEEAYNWTGFVESMRESIK